MKSRVLGFLLPFVLAAAAPAQNPAPAPATQEEQELAAKIRELETWLTKNRAEGLRAVKVNGKVLPPEQVRREAIYLVGHRLVEAKIADFFMEEWMQKALAEGRKPAEFEISEAAIMKELEGAVAETRIKNPGVEFWDAVRAVTGLDKEGFLKQRRQTEVFNKVFFPGPPQKWPQITKEAIMASAQGSNGQEFWNNIEKAGVDPEGKPRELPAFWMQLCRQWVQKQLKKWSDIRYPSDGLPPEICLHVNGAVWKTNEAFEEIRPALYPQDIERAMTEVIVREAVRQDLERQGAFLNDEQFRKEFDEFRKPYDDTPFNVEVIAVAFKGYPSLEAYRQRWRLLKSYENLIAKEINDDNLGAHGETFARFFGDGATSVDVIPFMAKDVKTDAWVPFGMQEARKRAQDAFDAIANGASFDQILEQRGEFFANDQEKGRLSGKAMNQLRQSLRENEFTDLLMGYSLGTYLFFDAEVGKVMGPLRGAMGYYVARVNARTPAKGPVQVSDSRTRELVKQDYVTYRFLKYANEVMGRATIE
ncbi:MAG: hypothetical protein IT458_15540 [Planctomycetes bacterium]|nr:hypothetical protein [Planctomycetota bacterium]